MDLDLSKLEDPEQPRPFRPGVPALDAFPFDTWRQLQSKTWRYISTSSITYGRAKGYRPLREAITEYLQVARGVRCSSSQVIVVSGTQQAIMLAAYVLLDPGDKILMEDPGYPRARGTFQAVGAQILDAPVDSEGLNVQEVNSESEARMAYTTPSHQYPLGVTMSLKRRLELLDWAQSNDAWVLEDDYDSEYRYEGRPIEALQGIDASERVIYTGTFSKVLFPALRLGYIVVPHDLEDSFEQARALIDRCPPISSQMVLHKFMAQGHFERHVRRMRVLYSKRREALIAALNCTANGIMPSVTTSNAGLHLIGWLRGSMSDKRASRRLEEHGIVAPPLSFYYRRSPVQNGLLLGYAATDEEAIRSGVETLAKVLCREKAK